MKDTWLAEHYVSGRPVGVNRETALILADTQAISWG
jgi:hypothetical protein